MSHLFAVRCECGEESNDYNHADEDLVKAVESSYVLHLLARTPWRDVSWGDDMLGELARFLGRHFTHGGFTVVGEYASDVPIPVKPRCPPGVYESMCLGTLAGQIDELQERLDKLKISLTVPNVTVGGDTNR